MKRVLLTGAAGFVGTNITAALLAEGCAVTALDRAFPAGWAAQFGPAPALTLIASDAGHLPDISADALIHGAAITATPEEVGLTPEAYFMAHLQPALHASEWAAQRGIRAVLITSSAVFGATPNEGLDEFTPSDPAHLYGAAKRAIEHFAKAARRLHGRDVVAARFSGIYGPYEVPRPTRPRIALIGRLIHEALREGVMHIAPDDPARDWTFAPDLGRALHALISTPRLSQPLYNVAAAQVYTTTQVAEMIQAALPGTRIVTDYPSTPHVNLRLGYLTNDRLRADTGFGAWTPFPEGLRQTIAWAQAALAQPNGERQ